MCMHNWRSVLYYFKACICCLFLAAVSLWAVEPSSAKKAPAEPALPDDCSIESIAVTYPERTIDIFGYEMNWIWLFFILSMIAGFIFKELLGIQV